MDNPILVLIFWGVINLFIKSAKDKKRAEQARNKRSLQGNMENQKTKPQTTKSIIEVFKDEIEREIKKEKELQSKKTKPNIQEVKQKPLVPVMNQVNPRVDYIDEEKPDELMEIINVESISSNKPGKTMVFNNKSDILKGILYSEILSQPKSIRNLKR